ncbi:MAG: dienelactone hydrolase [Phycisphaerae bacterium]|nr:dienelactone hydrolase [Phycisphaerae bacterium]|tara:strand:- start:3606 stop:4970 length:1365 start_codon:yes stop_codon:yes gene_type:complete
MAIKQPTDKSHFLLPDLGEGVAEAELISWKVQPGDEVAEHQTLAEMETDKALVEVPSPWAGKIQELHGNKGDIINVGSVLVSYGVGSESTASTEPPAADDASSGEDAGTVVGNVSGELTMPASFTRETPTASEGSSKSLATPAVRRIAREMDIDINVVNGTGRGGRVTASDIQAHASGNAAPASQQAAPTPAPAAPTAPVAAAPEPDNSAPMSLATTRVAIAPEGTIEKIPFHGIRRKIAQSLHHSVQTTVHFTVVDEADITRLEQKRSGFESLLGNRLSLLPFIMTAVCAALKKHPTLNANVDDFMEEIHIKGPVNLGCAVDTDHGLMVPVIHGAQDLTFVQMSERVRELAGACRNRTVPRESLAGGTFTISNVGSAGGMFATPIINYPEVAILAVGRAKETVLTRNGAFYAGLVLPLSLSCDHRVVDGAEGARFLNTLVGLLEAPETLLPEV